MISILFVLSTASGWTQTDGSTRPTGFFAEELGAPHRLFRHAEAEITFATPDGAVPTMDAASRDPAIAGADAAMWGDYCDSIASELGSPLRLEDVDVSRYQAVFVPGGHGPMEDLWRDAAMAIVLRTALESGKVVSAVCHGPAAFLSTADGRAWPFAGRRMVSITDDEERAFGTAALAPWLLESRLRELGAVFEGGPNWKSHVVRDGNVVTGQNPASSAATAVAVLDAIG